MASYSTAQRNACMDAVSTYIGNGGKLIVYAGTPPASANAALSGNTVLATFTMGTPFASAASSAAISPTLPSNVTIAATGTATFARQYKSDGTTVSMQLTVSATGGGGEIQFASTSFVLGATASITSISGTDGNA